MHEKNPRHLFLNSREKCTFAAESYKNKEPLHVFIVTSNKHQYKLKKPQQ